MKNTFKYSIIFIFLVLLSSCSKDKLDPVPQTSISELSAFDTPERIIGQINGMYDYMKSGQYRGGRFLIYNDIRAENFLNQSSNSVTGFQTWLHTVTEASNEVQNLWNAAYAGINAINVFLEGLDVAYNGDNVAGLTAEQYTQYVAEAKALRAITYFDLLQLYAQPYNKDNGASPGVPLRLIANKSSADNDLARSTVSEVYAQILADLNAAETGVALTHGDAYYNVTRLHKNAVIAFKTRVYLHMNNWSSVISEANKIVSANAPFTTSSGVVNGLQAHIADVFTTPYLTNESIFSIPMYSTDNPGTQNGIADYYNSVPRGGTEEYSMNPNGILGNSLWLAGDERRAMAYVADAKTWYNKFKIPSTNLDYVPVIRYAEVLLNLAEAEAKNAGAVNARALALLNAVRSRSAGVSYVAGDFANLTAYTNALMLERNIEFLCEGMRNLDLMRTLSTIPGKGNVNAYAPSTPNYIWPIPLNELLTNNLMTPNN